MSGLGGITGENSHFDILVLELSNGRSGIGANCFDEAEDKDWFFISPKDDGVEITAVFESLVGRLVIEPEEVGATQCIPVGLVNAFDTEAGDGG